MQIIIKSSKKSLEINQINQKKNYVFKKLSKIFTLHVDNNITIIFNKKKCLKNIFFVFSTSNLLNLIHLKYLSKIIFSFIIIANEIKKTINSQNFDKTSN